MSDVTATANDPLLAEMIRSGLMAAPEPAISVPDEIHDELLAELEAQSEAPAAPEGAGVIENAQAPEAIMTIEVAGEPEVNPIELTATTDEEIEGLDELLVEATPDEEVHSSILEGLEEQLAAQAAREEIYAEQDSKVGIVESTATPATPAKPAKSAAKPATPRAAGSSLPKREARFAAGSAGTYVAGVLGDAEIEKAVDGLPKKVKEKAANLADFLYRGRTLSVFTQVAVNILKEEGKLSNERLVKAFTTEATKRGMAAGYSIGTARSQAGQQIALFGRLGIAGVVGKELVPNAASPIWQKLSA